MIEPRAILVPFGKVREQIPDGAQPETVELADALGRQPFEFGEGGFESHKGRP